MNIPEKHDYCLDEVFKAKCYKNEVVIMHSAEYGLMHKGKCVDDAIGKFQHMCILHLWFSIPYTIMQYIYNIECAYCFIEYRTFMY